MVPDDGIRGSEREPELVGRTGSSLACGRENKLLLLDALLMTSGEVKRFLAWASSESGFDPSFAGLSLSILSRCCDVRRRKWSQSVVELREPGALPCQNPEG